MQGAVNNRGCTDGGVLGSRVVAGYIKRGPSLSLPSSCSFSLSCLPLLPPTPSSLLLPPVVMPLQRGPPLLL